MADPEIWSAETCKAYVDANIPRLRELIMDPVYRAAVNYLVFSAQPNWRRETPPGWLAGFNQFDVELRKLMTNTPPPIDNIDPWSYPTNQNTE